MPSDRPLGPDACRSDRCAPCTYYHLKLQALNGSRDKLTDEELVLVGVVAPPRDTSGGWVQAGDLAGLIRGQLSAADSAMLAALMGADVPGPEQLEFLG